MNSPLTKVASFESYWKYGLTDKQLKDIAFDLGIDVNEDLPAYRGQKNLWREAVMDIAPDYLANNRRAVAERLESKWMKPLNNDMQNVRSLNRVISDPSTEIMAFRGMNKKTGQPSPFLSGLRKRFFQSMQNERDLIKDNDPLAGNRGNDSAIYDQRPFKLQGDSMRYNVPLGRYAGVGEPGGVGEKGLRGMGDFLNQGDTAKYFQSIHTHPGTGKIELAQAVKRLENNFSRPHSLDRPEEGLYYLFGDPKEPGMWDINGRHDKNMFVQELKRTLSPTFDATSPSGGVERRQFAAENNPRLATLQKNQKFYNNPLIKAILPTKLHDKFFGKQRQELTQMLLKGTNPALAHADTGAFEEARKFKGGFDSIFSPMQNFFSSFRKRNDGLLGNEYMNYNVAPRATRGQAPTESGFSKYEAKVREMKSPLKANTTQTKPLTEIANDFTQNSELPRKPLTQVANNFVSNNQSIEVPKRTSSPTTPNININKPQIPTIKPPQLNAPKLNTPKINVPNSTKLLRSVPRLGKFIPK
jgi:hypothetical protein